MDQMLLGAAIPYLIGIIIFCAKKFRAGFTMLITVPVVMALGALWAIAPDLPRFFGATSLYSKLSQDPRCDIFFWHYTIDKIETDSNLYPALMVVMILSITWVAWHELRISEEAA